MDIIAIWVIIFAAVAAILVAKVDLGQSYGDMANWIQDVAIPNSLIVLAILIPIAAFMFWMQIRARNGKG